MTATPPPADRFDAIFFLLTSPFVALLIVMAVAAVVVVARCERKPKRNPYMAPWDRAERTRRETSR